MTKVDFYTGVDDKLHAACQLSHKAMLAGVRVLLHAPDEATAEELDRLLWHYPATAFIPHCRAQHPGAQEMPVTVSHQSDMFPHSELLISLHTACLPFFSRFERLIEIVGGEEQDAQLGRERYAFYRDRGYEMRHFNLKDKAA
jgi:DNA polymerase-3 subunit chi